MGDGLTPVSHQAPFMLPAVNVAATRMNCQSTHMQLLNAGGRACMPLLTPSGLGATAVQSASSDHAMAAALSLVPSKSGIRVTLENAELWQQFHSLGTEMVITKSGRRMFPCFGISLSGLDPNSQYTLAVRIIPVGTYRHKYINNHWIAVGKAEKSPPPSREHVHPDAPKPGSFWCKQPVNFKKLKLTNNRKGNPEHIILDSLHQYVPRVSLIKMTENGERGDVETIQFPETAFYAVTAYQNDQVTQLKIDTNPFAKAFRDIPSSSDDRDFDIWGNDAGAYQKWPNNDYYGAANLMSPTYRRLQSPYRRSGFHSPDLVASHQMETPRPSPYSPLSPYTTYRPAQADSQQRFFAASEHDTIHQWDRGPQQMGHNGYNVASYNHYQTPSQSQHRGHFSTGSSGYGSDGLSPSPTCVFRSLMQDLSLLPKAQYSQQGLKTEHFTSNEVVNSYEGYSSMKETSIQSFAPCAYASETAQHAITNSVAYQNMTTASGAVTHIPSHPIGQTQDHSEGSKTDLTPVLTEMPDIDSASDYLNWELA